MKKILVLMRETFPTNEILTEENLEEKRVLNPYDEYALFQAKKIREKEGGEIVCFFISRRESQYGLRTALGLGADRGIFFYYPNDDEDEIMEILAEKIKEENFDMIFLGIRDVNDNKEELPYRIGVSLNVPIYSHILSIDILDKDFIAKKEGDTTIDLIKFHKRGVVAFSQNCYEPEYPTIDEIMGIKNKTITIVESGDIEKKLEKNIIYQDIYRKQEIYSEVDNKEGVRKIIDYIKKWKIVD